MADYRHVIMDLQVHTDLAVHDVQNTIWCVRWLTYT